MRKGLYYDGVIARTPLYEDDSRYGGLIIGAPPFNILAILLVPFFCLIKDERKIRAINEAFTKVIYVPIAALMTVLFAVLSLLMVPVAYLVALYGKIIILVSQKPKIYKKKKKSDASSDKKTKKRAGLSMGQDLIIFILLGLPMLVISWLLDIKHFLVNIYRSDVKNYGLMKTKNLIMTEE